MAITNACISTCLRLAQDYQNDASYSLIELDSRVEIASLPRERVTTTIFSEKGLTHQGDGKSKATAILFTKPRTRGEAAEMIYRFLKRERLRIVGSAFINEQVPQCGYCTSGMIMSAAREAQPGFCTERENLCSDAKGEVTSG
jgi:hypothetical protein